jgi:hypothetical protein
MREFPLQTWQNLAHAADAAARAIRRRKFERTRRLSAYDPTVNPTDNELDDAEAAIVATAPFLSPQPSQSDEELARELWGLPRYGVTLLGEKKIREIAAALAAVREEEREACEEIARHVERDLGVEGDVAATIANRIRARKT